MLSGEDIRSDNSMFTGIIEEVGKLRRAIPSGDLRHLTILCNKLQEGLLLGASISCNGICLTVTAFDTNSITVSAMPETIKKTTLGQWHPNTLINMERALTMESRLDGHLVQGHIDTTTFVTKTESRQGTTKITFNLPKEGHSLIVEQGSIAVDGVSLTISSLAEHFFSVSLVEFTLNNTNLGSLKTGDKVNIEFDIIGKYINRINKQDKAKITAEKLYEHGF